MVRRVLRVHADARNRPPRETDNEATRQRGHRRDPHRRTPADLRPDRSRVGQGRPDGPTRPGRGGERTHRLAAACDRRRRSRAVRGTTRRLHGGPVGRSFEDPHQHDHDPEGGEMNGSMERFDTVIVGGGQAGLAMGYELKREGVPFTILDAQERVGDAWRTRWDSLRLFTPAWVDGLPGMPFPAPAWSFPTKDEMGDYLERYAEHFGLPVRTGTSVESLSKEGDRYVLSVADRKLEADRVIVATGAN